MPDLKTSLETIVDAGVKEPVQLRQQGRPETLADQIGRLEKISRDLASRLRRETIDAQCTAERKISEAHARYTRTLSEQTERLERERDEEIRQAIDEYHARTHELAGLLRRHA